MPLINRSADRFQRALEGERVTDDELGRLLETSQRLTTVGSSLGPRPDPAFVATLRERLAAEAASLPVASPSAARAAAARRAASRPAPAVLVVGRGLPRLVAGATASALLVGGVVGLVSRGAVPGDTLYPVKGWLDGVAVRLADSDLDRGRTQLDQAQEHISDARDLADRASPDSADIDTALDAATESVLGGQRSLDRAWSETGNPQALLEVRDFTARALPQVDALRTEVPAASLPELGRLEALLRQTELATARRIAACGGGCGAVLTSGLGPSSLPSSLTASRSLTASSTPAPTRTGMMVTVPGAPVTGDAGGVPPGPSVSGGTGGVAVGGGGSGATLSTGEATVKLPTLSATLPLPSATATVPLPTATVGTGGVTATVPGTTLGPVTLPGATIPIP
jgi:hypothetical protein